MVRRTWKRVAGHYYRDFVSTMKKGKKPHFLSAAILKKFEEYWKKPEVKKLSEMNTINRHKNVTLHKGGSKSYMQHRRDLRKELGREPTYMEVYLRVHRVEVEDDNGNVTYEWVDQRSSDFFDDYVRMKEEFGDVEMTPELEDSIFHRLNKIQNKHYGFGNQPALSSSSSIMVDNEEASRMKKMLEQNEKIVRELQEERKREQAEVVEQLRSGQEEIERLRHEQIEREERLRAEFEEQLRRERLKMNEMHDQMQAQLQAQSHMQSEMSRMMATFAVRQSSSCSGPN